MFKHINFLLLFIQIYSHRYIKLWEEGGESFHNELMVPAMLIYGAEDRFVTLEEEQWMHEVCCFESSSC